MNLPGHYGWGEKASSAGVVWRLLLSLFSNLGLARVPLRYTQGQTTCGLRKLKGESEQVTFSTQCFWVVIWGFVQEQVGIGKRLTHTEEFKGWREGRTSDGHIYLNCCEVLKKSLCRICGYTCSLLKWEPFSSVLYYKCYLTPFSS